LFQLATDLPAALLAKMLGIHLAVAVEECPELAGDGEGVAFVTRDSDQGTAATALGLTVR